MGEALELAEPGFNMPKLLFIGMTDVFTGIPSVLLLLSEIVPDHGGALAVCGRGKASLRNGDRGARMLAPRALVQTLNPLSYESRCAEVSKLPPLRQMVVY